MGVTNVAYRRYKEQGRSVVMGGGLQVCVKAGTNMNTEECVWGCTEEEKKEGSVGTEGKRTIST